MLLLIAIRTLDVLKYAVLIYVILGYFDGARSTVIYEQLGRIVNPLLDPFRRLLTIGYLDFSPVLVLITISMLQQVLINIFL